MVELDAKGARLKGSKEGGSPLLRSTNRFPDIPLVASGGLSRQRRGRSSTGASGWSETEQSLFFALASNIEPL